MDKIENIQGKYFNIIDDIGINTIIYQINRTPKNKSISTPKYTVERIEYTTEFFGEKTKKTFFVDHPLPEGNHLLIFRFSKNKVQVNSGFLDYDHIKISKKTINLNFKVLTQENTGDFKEFTYAPNLKKQIAIIDLETAQEISPKIYLDSKTNTLKGKYILEANKKYFAFEIKEKQSAIN